jgi:hypothetical protein
MRCKVTRKSVLSLVWDSIEVHRLRRRMAERLRTEVAGTLDPGATSAEIDAEMRYLVQALAHERRH